MPPVDGGLELVGRIEEAVAVPVAGCCPEVWLVTLEMVTVGVVGGPGPRGIVLKDGGFGPPDHHCCQPV